MVNRALHSVAVIDGREELWGRKGRAPTYGDAVALIGELSTKRGKKPDDILNAFTATPRGFGECFDSSTHAAEVKVAGDGYDITMKDEFKVHISKEELKLTSKASRFAGNDSSAIADANVVLAAFAKRKQQTGEYG
eukprot:gene9214-11708_t